MLSLDLHQRGSLAILQLDEVGHGALFGIIVGGSTHRVIRWPNADLGRE